MFNLNTIVRQNIQDIKPYSSARVEFSGNEGILLDANENPFGILNRYPDPHQFNLKKKIAELNGILSENIFIGNGSDEVIDLAFRIFCEPGKDKALTFIPTYGMYEVSASINNIELLKIRLNKNFQIDKNSLKEHLYNTDLKLIILCSPNNPTGNILNKDVLKFILKNFKGIVLLDEAYIDFCPKASLLNDLDKYPNLIISQTLSKAWGLASARIGIAFAGYEIINILNKVKPPYNISKLNQLAAISTLSDIQNYEQNKTIILEEKKKLEVEFKKISLIKKVYPSNANFLLIEVNDADKIVKSLKNQKIITRNRNSIIKNCLRITIGTKEENRKLINALKEE